MVACSKISELLKLIVSLLGLKEIRPYFIETTSVFRQIFRGMVYERRGLPAMTSDNIPEGIRLWLCRKGMGSLEHIRKIESIAGSLNWGLLMVVGALPRARKRSSRRTTTFNTPRMRQRLNEPFDPTAFARMKAFVTEMLDKENEAYRQRLYALRPEGGTTGAPVASSSASRYLSTTKEVLPITEVDHMAEFGSDNGSDVVHVKMGEFLEQCQQDEGDTLTFEPEYEAEIDFVEQLSTLTVDEMESERDSDDEIKTYRAAQIAGSIANENKLEFQTPRQTEDMGPVAKSRTRTNNIPIIPVEQINGSQVRVSNSGALQLRYEIDGNRNAIDVNLGKSIIPSSQDDVRSIHFTDRGIDLRDNSGQTIIHPKRSNGGTTLPLEELRNFGSGEALFALHRRVTGLDILPKAEGKPIPTKPLERQLNEEIVEAPVERDALWLLKQYVDMYFPNGGDFWPQKEEDSEGWPQSTADVSRFLR